VTDPTARPRLQLRLYIAGSSPNSAQARANATEICDAHFAADYDLEVIDLLEHPARGLEDGIIVTPTLLILLPPPTTRVIGTLADTQRVLVSLGAPRERPPSTSGGQ
jgi:circadian clock protein KaiB